MDRDISRRALISAILAAGVAVNAFSAVRGYLERFAPLSGAVWDATTHENDQPIESPYGVADVRYDEYGVPNITGENERALYFEVGYAQARDRAFQIDLQRRLMRGQLSVIVGNATLDSDEFHVKMDFVGAANATWNLLSDTTVGTHIEAYSEGVNAVKDDDPSVLEFSLLEYEPEPWTRRLDVATKADRMESHGRLSDAPKSTREESPWQESGKRTLSSATRSRITNHPYLQSFIDCLTIHLPATLSIKHSPSG